MKKFLLPLFVLLLASAKMMSQTTNFPEDFKLGTSYFRGFRLTPMTDELKQQYGMQTNPGIITDSAVKASLVNQAFPETAKIDQISVEAYQGGEYINNEAGIIVYKFHTKKDMEDVLPFARMHSTDQFFTIENFVILNWCAGNSSNCKKIFAATARHYKEKLNAVLLPAPHFSEVTPEDAAVSTAAAAAESIEESAAEGDSTAVSVETSDFVPEELRGESTVGNGYIATSHLDDAQTRLLVEKLDAIKKLSRADVILSEYKNDDHTDLDLITIATPSETTLFITILVDDPAGNYRIDADDKTMKKLSRASNPISVDGKIDFKNKSTIYAGYASLLDSIINTLKAKN